MQIVSVKSLAATLLLFAGFAGIAAHADPVITINYDQFTGVSYSGVPDGVGGLNYQNFALLDTNNNVAFQHKSASGVEVIYDGSGQTAGFSSPTALTLYSFYIDSTNNGQRVTLTGYDFGGNLIDTLNLSISSGRETLVTLNWTGLANVIFTPTNDTGYFSLDDVTISQAAPTPEPSSLALLGTGLLGVIGAARKKFKA